MRKVLFRLVNTGVVLQVPGGFMANREHIAWPSIDLLSHLHGTLIERIRDRLNNRPEHVIAAAMFGSAARRDGDERSDIDVVILSDADTLHDLTDDLAERIRAWTGNPAQVVGLSAHGLRRLRDYDEPILQEWSRDMVVICGDRSALPGAS